MRRLRDLRWPIAAGLGGAVFVLVLAARSLGLLAHIEFDVYDWLLRNRSAAEAPDSRIVLIRVQEADIARYGYPLSDALLATAIETLLDADPVVVGVDIYRDRPVGEGRRQLEQTLLGDARVVLVEKLGDAPEKVVAAPRFLPRQQIGFNDLVRDPDGVVRRGLLYAADRVSLALRLADRYLRPRGAGVAPDPVHPQLVRLGETSFPHFRGSDGSYVDADDAGYQYLLDYRGASVPFVGFSLSQLLEGEVRAEAIRDRVVLLGITAASVKDHCKSPAVRGRESFCVEVQAHAVSQLLRAGLEGQGLLHTLSDSAEAAWLLLWSLCGALLGMRLRSPLSFLTTLLAGLALVLGIGVLAFARSLWVPVVPPALAACAAAGIAMAWSSREERAQRQLVMQLFARNVGQKVADRIWEQREEFMDGGRPRSQRLILTVLMADLKGFTATAEKMDPALLMDWVNEYMSTMARLVEEHGGAVDDYAGDGIKANFGAPVPRENEEAINCDARNAIECAIAMSEAMQELNRRWEEGKRPTARLRIGIHTGPAVVGSLGSDERLKFTSVGDTVNTASRLERFEQYAFTSEEEASICRILIGEETFQRVKDLFEIEPLGEHPVPGKAEKIPIYRVHADARR